ncbi:MAG: hypothetical protein HY040_18415 [Planctomycetes bacterium]|nr:hypothetical protein [Planctomycetota bacterium]
MDTLERFLKTGDLGEIRLGISPEEVRRLLGNPEDISTQKKPLIWKFGPLELSFLKESQRDWRLIHMSLHVEGNKGSLPARLSWTGWMPDCKTSREAIEGFLAVIALAPIPIDDWDHMNLPSGVQIVFQGDKIHSLHLSRTERAKLKQVSISLPDNVWQELRKEAERRQVSPSGLISQLVDAEAKSFNKESA